MWEEGRGGTGSNGRGESGVSQCVDPACPLPMTTYLVLDIQTGAGLDQQAYDAVVAIRCGHNERRPAKLHHEWTCRGSKGARVDRRVGGGARRNEVEREREG